MATLPEKSFQGQPLLEKNNQVQKIQIILGKKIPAAIQWFDEKKTLCLNVKFESNHQLIKHNLYQQTKKKIVKTLLHAFVITLLYHVGVVLIS